MIDLLDMHLISIVVSTETQNEIPIRRNKAKKDGYNGNSCVPRTPEETKPVPNWDLNSYQQHCNRQQVGRQNGIQHEMKIGFTEGKWFAAALIVMDGQDLHVDSAVVLKLNEEMQDWMHSKKYSLPAMQEGTQKLVSG
jgi:hypothetical protein